ncbi:MAG: tetratricopeptide repeat protein [Bacteroidetes bacterium]|nr:tetratricopeptide repeat protein [Bacteroidota bacterium]
MGDIERQFSQIMRLLKEGKAADALRLAETVLVKFPEEPLLHAQIASCYSDMGDQQRAIERLRNAESLFGDNHIIESSFACVYMRLKRYDIAEKYLRKALSVTPPGSHLARSDYLNTLGEFLWRRGSGIEAVDAWRKAVDEYPANMDAKWNLVKHKTPGSN